VLWSRKIHRYGLHHGGGRPLNRRAHDGGTALYDQIGNDGQRRNSAKRDPQPAGDTQSEPFFDARQNALFTAVDGVGVVTHPASGAETRLQSGRVANGSAVPPSHARCVSFRTQTSPRPL
jgi:hypothetical protein